MPYLKPAMLKKGETIGIIAPSSPFSSIDKKHFYRGIKFIEQLGFEVKLGYHQKLSDFKKEHGIFQRAKDVNDMFCDKSVKAILCAIGGYSSNDILELLDYKSIKENPKIFVGFSDITFINFALLVNCGMVTFYGPMLVNFSAPDVHPYMCENFEHILTRSQVSSTIYSADEFSDDSWYYHQGLIKRKWLRNSCEVFREGYASGLILAANLETLVSLAGTKYFPKFDTVILFLESSGGQDWRKIARDLMHIRLMGVFGKVKGLVFGRFPIFRKLFKSINVFHEVLNYTLRGYDFPVLYNFSFGHTEPICTLPIGIKCTLDTSKKSIKILEQCVIKEHGKHGNK